MLHLAHIINPFKAKPGSDLHTAQPITFASMLHAKSNANSKLKIDLYSAHFIEDLEIVPKEFILTNPLNRSVSDLAHFNKPLQLPLIQDILERLYHASEAEYLIYTNVDIGLYPNFYNKVASYIEEGYDALMINRRRLKDEFHALSQLPLIYQEKGKAHPGFDCFIFHRSLVPKFKLEGICIGVPFIEISFSQNLFAYSRQFKLVDNEILTFHIGEEIFKKRAPREYYRYNRKQFHLIEKKLEPDLDIRKFPYSQLPFLKRIIKWALHPCFPIRLVLKLELKKLRTG